MIKQFFLFTLTIFTGASLLAQGNFDDYVFFDDSPTSTSYDPSWGFVNAPSTLERVGEKFPVDSEIYFQGENSLRLHWTSNPGGDWGFAVAEPGWPGHDVMQRDTLSFWVYSDSLMPSSQLPLVYLEDLNNEKTEKFSLTSYSDDIPDSQWTQLKVPLNIFYDAAQSADLGQIKTIFFGQDTADGNDHSLWLDEIRMYIGNPNDTEPPAVPTGIAAKGYQRHVDLEWTPNTEQDLQGYNIYRSRDNGPFIKVGYASREFHHSADYLGEADISASYRISAVDRNYNESELSPGISASTESMTDEELLTMVQEATFRFFWDYAHPVSGLTRERIPVSENLVTTGGSGFGVMAILVGIDRGFITREQGVERMQKILDFLDNAADRYHGAWSHWMNGTTGETIPFSTQDDGGDLVETAFMIQGLLAARAYFDGTEPDEQQIRQMITDLWESVEWDWYRRSEDSDVLYWHWSPNYEWAMNFPLRGWNETMITYILGVASPTYGVPAIMYEEGWAGSPSYDNGEEYYGHKLYVGNGTAGPLFFTHYSFLGFDPRYKKDAHANYFIHNRNQTLVNRAYCIENPGGYEGYGENSWGLTASEDPFGYLAHEPSEGRDNGTLTPTAALSSMPYTPEESMGVLKHFYREYGDELWGPLGYYDAINPSEDWASASYLAIDQGPIIIMIENHRSRLLWDLFMSNQEIRTALDSIGFVPDSTQVGIGVDPANPLEFKLEGNYPNPFNPQTTIRFTIPRPSEVSIAIYNIRGELVEIVAERLFSTGSHEVTWTPGNVEQKFYSSGIYFYRVSTPEKEKAGKMLLLK